MKRPLLLLVLASTSASAQFGQGFFKFDTVKTAGLLTGIASGGGTEPAQFLLGIEATYHRQIDEGPLWFGGYGQAETVGFQRFRLGLGAQTSLTIFGLETGLALETGTATRPPRLEAQASPFVSFLLGSFAVRLSLPLEALAPTAPEFQLPGLRVAAVLTLKLPLPSNQHRPGPPASALPKKPAPTTRTPTAPQ